MTPIERVAIAIFRGFCVSDAVADEFWGRAGFAVKDQEKAWRLARAAIEAMREPSEKMVSAANRLNHPRDIEIWQAMIDMALAEGDGK